jgi:CubicO group peptidase (beta-lactamase class C family)
MFAPSPTRRRVTLARAFPALALALAAACAPAVAPAGSSPRQATAPSPGRVAPVFPGAEWERVASPESAGWSGAGLDSVKARLAQLPTTAMLAVVGGRVLLEHGDPAAVSYLASVRKSVLSMLFGRYVADGRIGLDRTLAELGIDDVGGLTPAEKRATVRHLLSARSGVYHPASNPGDNLADAPPRGSQRPGEYFLYSNWDFNALGTVFERATGRSIYDALGSDLARPLGMQDFDRAVQQKSGDATRSVHLAYHMDLSTRDMARLGLLMLREGSWAGEQVVPREWVRESTRAVTRSAEMNPASLRGGPFGYGYLWWVFDRPELGPAYRGGYAGMGAYGQYLVVLPALDLVVAHKTRPGQGREVSLRELLGVLELLVGARCPGACPAADRALSPAPRAGGPAAAPQSPAGERRSPAWRAPRRTGAPPRTAPAATGSGR